MLLRFRWALLGTLVPSLTWAQAACAGDEGDAKGQVAVVLAPSDEDEGSREPLPPEEEESSERSATEAEAITDAEVDPEVLDGDPSSEEQQRFFSAPKEDVREDHDAVFRSFAVYARDERARRIAGSLGGIGLGGATIGVGAILARTTSVNPMAFYVVGGVGAGLSLIGLLLPSPAEILARQHRVSASGHSAEEAEAFEAKWADAARGARRRRMTGAVMNLVVGAAGVGVGIALAAGAGSLEEAARATWGSVLVGAGAAFLVGGATGLVVQSPVESSYAEYAASKPKQESRPLEVSVGLLPGGAFLGAQGHF